MNFAKDKLLGLFVLFFFVGLIIGSRSLSYPWFWDDLHLIRDFTPSELHSILIGTFDVYGYPTLGYRPLMVFFDHARALVFGENTTALRLFEIILFAISLTVFASHLALLKVPYVFTALGGTLALCSHYNWFHQVWISDAIHTFAGLCVLFSALCLLMHIDKPAPWKLAMSATCAAMALFVTGRCYSDVSSYPWSKCPLYISSFAQFPLC